MHIKRQHGKVSKVIDLPVSTVTPSVTVCEAQRHSGKMSAATAKKQGRTARYKNLEPGTYVLVRAETGEEVDRYHVDGRAPVEDKQWVRLYQRLATEIVRVDPPLSSTEHRALWFVIGTAGFGAQAEVQVGAVAEEWGISRETLSRALSRLVALRIIERKRSKNMNVAAFRINPNFVWKGDHRFRDGHIAAWGRRDSGVNETPSAYEHGSSA